MKTLGICHDVLIASAALVEDGVVVNAIAEERLDRQKQSRGFPAKAINWCLSDAGLSLSDIDEIAIAWNPAIDLESVNSSLVNHRRHRSEHLYQVPAQLMKISGVLNASEVIQSSAGNDIPPINYVNHYHAHIGNSYFMSGWKDSSILIMDGRAEKQTSLLAVANGVSIDSLVEVNYPHSLGLFYGTITQFLGFRPDSDEWKVMALGSDTPGENPFTPLLRNLISINATGGFQLSLEYFEFYNQFDRRMFSDKFVATFGSPRAPGDSLELPHKMLAAAMQLVFEETVTKILNILYEKTNNPRLSLSGGCFMNSVYNGKITSQTPFSDVFISSCPDDSGTAVGAALYIDAQRRNEVSACAPISNYWGPQFSDEHCLRSVMRYKIPNYTIVDDRCASAAEDLVAGKIVGWFQGRMEFGQRALGNRSILLDPRRKDGKEIVNSAVKFRESFRPFAPSILLEHVGEWFHLPDSSTVNFMERVYRFKEHKMSLVPAVVHTDGTGRLQTVTPDSNRYYYDLISHFYALTDVPIVLNTSFNLNGEPVVCSPEDAIRSFFTCGLDVLYLGNVRICKDFGF